ncbi:heat shock protein HspQ [Motiliproteus sp. SC1-56]|uniref:heat shock protein HspQ n=1 Tax=Motiliproteus sp. SC1-56 TaxID=2799565 RepID=UPI001A8CB19F|nr:heat shock protein HspQ [Motiliproteus sp. SC1-56]
MRNARFGIGQLVRHRLFNYRGVVVDVDPRFMLSEAWYQQVAKSRPPKEAPWYRVLVHNAVHETYVAERNLEADPGGEPVNHPELGQYFEAFSGGRYRATRRSN